MLYFNLGVFLQNASNINSPIPTYRIADYFYIFRACFFYKFAYSNNFGLEIGVLAKSLQQAQQEVEELRQDYETDEAILDDLTSYFHYDGRGAQHSELIECAEAVCEQILELKAENARLREALEDITIGEQHNAEYSKCDEWIEPWFGDICPCIDCGVCIAKQALKAKEKNELS